MRHFPPKPEHLDTHSENDLLVLRVRGAIDEPTARYIVAAQNELSDKFGYALELYHGQEMTTITPEARRIFLDWNRNRKFHGSVAGIGASFALKTVANLLSRGANLLAAVPGEMMFFDTEAEARAWLDDQRRNFHKK